MSRNIRFQKILGIPFFVGEAQQAIDLISGHGGLVVVPSGPGMRTLAIDPVYREALLGADLAIADSGFMVLLWNILYRPRISKLSGLKYLRTLLLQEDFRRTGATLWVMPHKESAERTIAWLREQDISVDPEDVYVAPLYNGCVQDPALLEAIERRHRQHVVLCVGSGVQEPLGFYLKQRLSYLPMIHCIGAAVGFLTGDQVHIPMWVDHLGLGWLWRTVSNPRRFFPRYWEARRLAGLMVRYGEKLPVIQ
jgi:N-acetylglucosaminyldiphosphoundecaprenol N-acetyl-beta-D-mannosaminyltransferase